MALAPRSDDYPGAKGEDGVSSAYYELPCGKMHGSSTKFREERIHDQLGGRCGPTGPAFGAAAFEPTGCSVASAREKIDAALSSSCNTMGSMGQVLLQELLEVLPLRSQYTGGVGRKALFPLPSSIEFLLEIEPDLSVDESSWVLCLIFSLNSLWGAELSNQQRPNTCQKRCLEELVSLVKTFSGMSVALEDLSWEDYLQVKSIDYRGDEVKVGRWFTWSNISPALPAEIGKVPLEEVCTLGCRHYVEFFDSYLRPPDQWRAVRPPRVMVNDSSWSEVCTGLVFAGVCLYLEESEVFHLGSSPLNGLFGVSKEDYTEAGVEIFRLIMDLRPLNALCMPLSGDVDTLPSWGGMTAFFLQPKEHLVISSEDVKCFFYTMKVPHCWVKFLAFNKLVPQDALPRHLWGKRIYLASAVLPMGFLNSVSLAQHVHRNLVAWSAEHSKEAIGELNAPEQELRKDRNFTVSNPSWRVYLDNYDLLERVEATEIASVRGTVAPGILALRQEYERWEIPRNYKKSVERSLKCEMQGATVDGFLGVAYPREAKLARYFSLALKLAQATSGTQKQWQVVCGGLVYVSMFRRPLLGCLNSVWSHIESFNHSGSKVKRTPADCKLEVLRFLGLLPLAKLDFRLDVHPIITCSDASSTGGGICASTVTTAIGRAVAEGGLRGEQPDPHIEGGVVAVSLFDGIGAFRVALELLGLPVLGYVAIEKSEAARRVVERNYPGVIHCQDVVQIQLEDTKQWSMQFSQASLVLIGAGPPCQGVSGLNCDRKGALRDERSSLFGEVPRIRDLVRQAFKWCPVYTLMESVASMDMKDRNIMTQGIGVEPLRCDAGSLTWCHRPRLYWCDWEIVESEGYTLSTEPLSQLKELTLSGWQDPHEVIRNGWIKVEPAKAFPTFTTARPRLLPGRKPAGVQQCSWEELERWKADLHRFPPYQYCSVNCLVNKHNQLRLPDVSERELMLGFPLGYTAGCLPKNKQKGDDYNDCRLTLLGNTWSVVVVSCLLAQLCWRLGLIEQIAPQKVLDRAAAGGCPLAQGRLTRLPLNPSRQNMGDASQLLAHRLSNLISIKGEDILLTTPTSQLTKFHRMRATIPSRCWRWRIVAGWRWKQSGDHINGLELRAILTSLRWRLEHAGHFKTRFLHLTDSLVCLHALSRGRSSSRKLRRTMSRINALILACGVHPLWGYVRTEQNPADKPSRWGRQVRSKFRNGKA